MQFGALKCAAAIAVTVISCAAAVAQDAEVEQAPVPSAEGAQTSSRTALRVQVIAFDRSKILAESELGQAFDAKLEKIQAAILAENDIISAALEDEERALSDIKPTLTAEEFALRADAFDKKVIAIRAEQKQKSDVVQDMFDQGTREFEENLNRVLSDIAREVGAVAVFERSQIYMMSGTIDVSNEAIKRLTVADEPETLGDIGDSTPPISD